MDCSPPGCSVHGDSLGMNTGVGSHSLLQEIFPTQSLNLSPALEEKMATCSSILTCNIPWAEEIEGL